MVWECNYFEDKDLKSGKTIINEDRALDLIKDGMTIAIGGFITAHHPMSILRGIAKRKIKNLVVIGSLSASFEVDILIGCGCVKKLAAAYVGAESVAPIGPFFKFAVENEQLELWECDEIILAAQLQASAFGLPFFPVRGGLGTDLPVINQDLKEFVDPVNREKLLAVPARHIDIAITHASRADERGNIQYTGNSYMDVLISRAADVTLTSVERIVPTEFTRQDPFKTAYKADYVLKAPFGSHPFSCHGSYREDEHFLSEYGLLAYAATKGDAKGWTAFREKYIDKPGDHFEYLEEVGIKNLFSLDEFQ